MNAAVYAIRSGKDDVLVKRYYYQWAVAEKTTDSDPGPCASMIPYGELARTYTQKMGNLGLIIARGEVKGI